MEITDNDLHVRCHELYALLERLGNWALAKRLNDAYEVWQQTMPGYHAKAPTYRNGKPVTTPEAKARLIKVYNAVHDKIDEEA